MTLLTSAICQQFRLTERMRLLWKNWWHWDHSNDAPLRRPLSLQEVTSFLHQSPAGSTRLLVSSSVAATSSLHVTLLSLPPGHELPSRRAPAVEFYCVLAGKGKFSQQGVVETHDIAAGLCFVVDPGSMRWISNSYGSTELLLVRATDGGDVYNRKDLDAYRADPNRKTAVDLLNDGIKKVHTMAKDYVKS